VAVGVVQVGAASVPYPTGVYSGFVSNAAFRGGFYETNVFCQSPASGFERRRDKRDPAGSQFIGGQIHVDFVVFCIDGDAVPILKQSEDTSDLSLRCDVADDKTVRTAAEATVSQECDVGSEAGSHDR